MVHSLRYDAGWRELACLDRSTPFAVRQQAGHSLKSAVKHVLTVDKRDSSIFPTEGALIRSAAPAGRLGVGSRGAGSAGPCMVTAATGLAY